MNINEVKDEVLESLKHIDYVIDKKIDSRMFHVVEKAIDLTIKKIEQRLEKKFIVVTDHQRLDMLQSFKEHWKAIGPLVETKTRPWMLQTLQLKEWILDNPKKYQFLVIDVEEYNKFKSKMI